MSSRFIVPIYLLALAAVIAALYGFWAYQGRTVVLPEIASATHKLQCVSYSPFAKDQSPLAPSFVIRPEQMDADLAILAKYFSCVRTYSMTGLEQLPVYAQKHGLKVMLGAWVGSDPVSTKLEIDQLIAAANRYPDVVQSVIVGNEALLRKDISGARLAELITQVKSQVHQPVTYADVWEFWDKNPEVAPAVDFITIHLLPYWEDEPSSIDRALDHVANIREDFGRRFSPKDILIGETGWPSEGRQRETARTGRINQAKFIRGFVAMAEHNGWDYNLIEAFDQPWKRVNEGAVGGYWGLFDADRQDKQVLAGPVSDLSNWQSWLQISAAIGVLTLIVVGVPQRPGTAVLGPLFALIGSIGIALWWQQAVNDNRDIWEWLWTAALTLLNIVILVRTALALAPLDSARGRVFVRLEQYAGKILLCSGFIGAVLTLQLVFDARYREFPSYIMLVPALGFLRWPAHAAVRELKLLLAIIALGIPLQLLEEKLTNTQALGWAAVSALLALALWRSLRTSRSPAISSANTASVTV
ncbi:MAG: ndvC [Verrucomicrobiaceae bacterium]|nr:ndvC [Verrucomicrobiaceae bacterium]